MASVLGAPEQGLSHQGEWLRQAPHVLVGQPIEYCQPMKPSLLLIAAALAWLAALSLSAQWRPLANTTLTVVPGIKDLE